jgi:NAD(P)H-dependent FMN reductase
VFQPVLQIIVADSRPFRAGAAVGAWIAEAARAHGGFEIDVVDLAEIAPPLPGHLRRWSARVRRAHAFVLVTPEDDDGCPASLRDALDRLDREWWYKAVSFVVYGGASAGPHAVRRLRQVVGTLRMVPVTDTLSIPSVGLHVDEGGSFRGGGLIDASAKRMLDELMLVGAPLIPLQSGEGRTERRDRPDRPLT